jgi:hypothetical protein
MFKTGFENMQITPSLMVVEIVFQAWIPNSEAQQQLAVEIPLVCH